MRLPGVEKLHLAISSEHRLVDGCLMEVPRMLAVRVANRNLALQPHEQGDCLVYSHKTPPRSQMDRTAHSISVPMCL